MPAEKLDFFLNFMLASPTLYFARGEVCAYLRKLKPGLGENLLSVSIKINIASIFGLLFLKNLDQIFS